MNKLILFLFPRIVFKETQNKYIAKNLKPLKNFARLQEKKNNKIIKLRAKAIFKLRKYTKKYILYIY